MDNRDLRTSITYLTHYQDKHGLRVETSWGELFHQFSDPLRSTRSFSTSERLRDAWSPATFKNNFRPDGPKFISALVLDYDRGEFTFEFIRARWSGYFGLIHTTASHTPQKPALRVILPFSRSVTAEKYLEIWDRVAGEGVDRACRDPSRFWFMPTYIDAFEFAELTGELLNPDLFEPTIDLRRND